MVGCLVVGALVAVAVMGGLAASKNNAAANTGANADANAGQTVAPTTAAPPVTTQRITTTTQRVTTTTSRAEALALLRSRVVVAPANGAPRWSLSVPVSVHATGAKIERVHITGGPGTHVLAGGLDPYTGVWHSTGTLFPSTTYTVGLCGRRKCGDGYRALPPKGQGLSRRPRPRQRNRDGKCVPVPGDLRRDGPTDHFHVLPAGRHLMPPSRPSCPTSISR